MEGQTPTLAVGSTFQTATGMDKGVRKIVPGKDASSASLLLPLLPPATSSFFGLSARIYHQPLYQEASGPVRTGLDC